MTKGADSRDKVKHNEWSDQLFLEWMMKVAEQQQYEQESYEQESSESAGGGIIGT